MTMLGNRLGTAKQGQGQNSALTFARGLGWFSIGLGLIEIAAPHQLARLIGLRRRSQPVVQTYGLREVATGTAILAARNPAPFVWGRVAGDALDMASLSSALFTRRRKTGIAIALAAVGAVAAIDVLCAWSLRYHHRQMRKPVPDYRGRSGFSRPVQAMRGAARDFKVPKDMKTVPPVSAVGR